MLEMTERIKIKQALRYDSLKSILNNRLEVRAWHGITDDDFVLLVEQIVHLQR